VPDFHRLKRPRPPCVSGPGRGKTDEAIRRCQAGSLHNAHYYDQARLFARLVAQYSANLEAKDKLFICTGGGPGIMQAANRGAHELGAP
jgi:predicted Rossmann-fold nucleotide-binding protein